MELFTDFMGVDGGGQALGRFAHYLGGITWIGLLYFFNFIQGAAFSEMGDAARGEALRKITWRTLWWFRWAAALTWVSGIWILGTQELINDMDYWRSAPGMGIAFGMLLGTMMAANVWMRIWPAQQRIITAIKNGEAPDGADVALAGTRSKPNTYMSAALLLFMIGVADEGAKLMTHDTLPTVGAVFILSFVIIKALYAKAAKVPGF